MSCDMATYFILQAVRLGTKCLEQSTCEADTQCCVVSSYVIKRGKCAAMKR